MGLLEHVASAIKAYRYHMVAVCLIFFDQGAWNEYQ
jgi:hypothetical protein